MSSSGVNVKCDWCDTIGTVPDGEWGIHCTRCGRLLLIPLGRRDRYIGIGDLPEILISRVDKKVVLMKYEGHEYIIGNYTNALINGQTVCGTLKVYHATQRIVDDYRKTRDVVSCSAVANNDEPCSSTQNQNNEAPEPERKKRRSSADSDEL